MIPIDLKVQVSEKALQLLNSGKAYFGPGGVRLHNGQFVELYKILPFDLSNTSPVIKPINPMTVFTQAADIISQSANVVLSYQNGQKINKVIKMMSALQGIAWANTAIGAANMALTAMSFSVINSKLDSLSQQIASAVTELKHELKAIQLEEKSIEILTLIGNLKSTSHYLSINSVSRQDEIQVENYLNEARQLIGWLKEQFEEVFMRDGDNIFAIFFYYV